MRPFGVLLAAGLSAGALPAAATTPPACDPEAVVLYPDDAPSGGVAFTVEVADEPEERARGLMHRTELARDAGMIFVFPRVQPASFWMRNTPLPLDIIFIGDDGRVVNVAENTTPFSEEAIPSDAPVRAVLEVNAGLAGELGIGPGTPVRHPAFEQARPPWSCHG